MFNQEIPYNTSAEVMTTQLQQETQIKGTRLLLSHATHQALRFKRVHSQRF